MPGAFASGFFGVGNVDGQLNDIDPMASTLAQHRPALPLAPSALVGRARSVARRIGIGGALVAAYPISVAIVEALRRGWHVVDPDGAASSPARLAAGHVWELVTSGFVVAGQPLPQLAGIALVAFLVVRRHGAATFGLGAVAAHIGATLAAYAAVGALWMLRLLPSGHVLHAPDYGVSVVWTGSLGVLAAGAALTIARRGTSRREIAVLAGALLGFAAVLPFWEGIAGIEHVLGFFAGALVVLARDARCTAAARAYAGGERTAGEAARDACAA